MPKPIPVAPRILPGMTVDEVYNLISRVYLLFYFVLISSPLIFVDIPTLMQHLCEPKTLTEALLLL